MAKEFIQDPRSATSMKCNSCGQTFKAIGLQEGRTCRAPLNTNDPNRPHGNRCNGSLFEISEDLSEAYKRQSDARLNKP